MGSRRRVDLVWAGMAGLGVAALGVEFRSLDPVGVLFAVLAAVAWAGYILLSGPVGRAWSGLTGASVGSLVGALGWAVPGIIAGGAALWQPWVLVVGLAVGILSSAIPYGLELVARRQIPSGTFSILMSLEPAVAALSALVVLGERLAPVEVIAMACVIIASVGATRSMRVVAD